MTPREIKLLLRGEFSVLEQRIKSSRFNVIGQGEGWETMRGGEKVELRYALDMTRDGGFLSYARVVEVATGPLGLLLEKYLTNNLAYSKILDHSDGRLLVLRSLVQRCGVDVLDPDAIVTVVEMELI